MNATVTLAKPKRSHHKKKSNGASSTPTPKPPLPPVDGMAAAIEAARHAQEGNTRLARAIDVLREGLQTIAVAEMDNYTKMPVSAQQLRVMAVETLDAAAALAGQNWRTPRNQVVRTRAGRADHDLSKNRGNEGSDYD